MCIGVCVCRAEVLTVEAHRLSHTHHIFYLVIAIAIAISFLLYGCKERNTGVRN